MLVVSLNGQRNGAVRVLFVHRWGVTMAGGERWINNLSHELLARGCHVSAALHTDGPLSSALQNMGAAVYLCNIEFLQSPPKHRLVATGLRTLRTSTHLMRLIRKTRSQLIHVFSLEAAESAFFAARLRRVPMIVTVMNCGPYPVIDVQILKRADGVIAISESVKRDVLSCGVAARKVWRIPLGVEFDAAAADCGDLREELGIPAGAPLVGMVANLEPKKAQDVLIRAMPLVGRSHPTAHLVFFGTDKHRTNDRLGPYESELRALVSRLELEGVVHFAGFRPDASRYVAQFSVAVLCSRREAQGLAAIEALAAGVPLVASEVEGLREVVRGGRTGLLVPPDAPESLGSAIDKLLTERDFASNLARRGREDVRARFNASTLAVRNRVLYDEILTQANSRKS